MGIIFSGGHISGGHFNPAVAVGVILMGLQTWGNIWIFLLANFGGAALAAFTYRYVNGEE